MRASPWIRFPGILEEGRLTRWSRQVPCKTAPSHSIHKNENLNWSTASTGEGRGVRAWVGHWWIKTKLRSLCLKFDETRNNAQRVENELTNTKINWKQHLLAARRYSKCKTNIIHAGRTVSCRYFVCRFARCERTESSFHDDRNVAPLSKSTN